jgi:hypothetical protein
MEPNFKVKKELRFQIGFSIIKVLAISYTEHWMNLMESRLEEREIPLL